VLVTVIVAVHADLRHIGAVAVRARVVAPGMATLLGEREVAVGRRMLELYAM